MKEKAKKEKNCVIKTERNFPLILDFDKNQECIEIREILDCLEKKFGFIKNSIQLKNKDDNKILNVNESINVKNLDNIVVCKSKYKNLSFKVNEKIVFENKKNKIQQKKIDDNFHKMKSENNINNNKNIFNNNNKLHHSNTNYNEINNNNYFKNYYYYNYNFEDYENDDYFDDDNYNENYNNPNKNKNDINKLKEMGFNKNDCIKALTQFDGNFEAALNYLISKNEY